MEIAKLLFWHWWVIGLALVVIEAMFPSGYFMAMAVAGAATGGMVWFLTDIDWQFQLAVFTTLSIILSIALRQLYKKRYPSDYVDPLQAMIGLDFELSEPIKHGMAEVEIKGELYTLKGPELPKGASVRVVAIDGGILAVRPIRFRKSEDSATSGESGGDSTTPAP